MAIVSGTILDDAGAVYNVKNADFAGGAKGDGVTNDFAAITAAISAATATGGVVYFPPGTYIVSQKLNGVPLKRNVLVGANRDSTIIKHQTGGTVIDWQTVGFSHDVREFSCRLEELTIDGNNGTGVVVDLANLTLCRMYGVNVYGRGISGAPANCIGLRLTSLFDSHFQDIYVASCGGPGGFTPCVSLDSQATGDAELNNCQFYNLHIEPGPTDAILLACYGNANNPIVDNFFYGLKTHGDLASGRPNNAVVKLSQYTQGNAFFGLIVAFGNSTSQGEVECDGQRNVWYSPRVGGTVTAPPASAFHFTQHAVDNIVWCADVVNASSFSTAPFVADSGSLHNRVLFPHNVLANPLRDLGHNMVWWDSASSSVGTSLQNLGGISATSTPANNLSGTFTISGGNTQFTVLGLTEADVNYRLVVSPTTLSGSPATGSWRVKSITKQTSQFVVTVEAAPSGIASVSFDWVLTR